MCRFLKILLKRVATSTLIGIILALIYESMPVRAENDSIQISTEQTILYSAEETISISVSFLNTELYNDHTYLAYHVKDEQGNTLRYETSRFHVALDENNMAILAVNINVSDIETEKGILLLEFDLVDEENSFWYSDRAEIGFQTCVVRCETKGFDRVIKYIKQQVGERPYAVCCNLIIFIFFWVTVCIVKRKNSICRKMQ